MLEWYGVVMVHSLYALQNIDIDSYFALDHPNQICIEDVGEMVALIVECHYLQSPVFRGQQCMRWIGFLHQTACSKAWCPVHMAPCFPMWSQCFKPSRIGLTLVPNIVNLRQVGFCDVKLWCWLFQCRTGKPQVLQSCKQLRVSSSENSHLIQKVEIDRNIVAAASPRGQSIGIPGPLSQQCGWIPSVLAVFDRGSEQKLKSCANYPNWSSFCCIASEVNFI